MSHPGAVGGHQVAFGLQARREIEGSVHSARWPIRRSLVRSHAITRPSSPTVNAVSPVRSKAGPNDRPACPWRISLSAPSRKSQRHVPVVPGRDQCVAVGEYPSPAPPRCDARRARSAYRSSHPAARPSRRVRRRRSCRRRGRYSKDKPGPRSAARCGGSQGRGSSTRRVPTPASTSVPSEALTHSGVRHIERPGGELPPGACVSPDHGWALDLTRNSNVTSSGAPGR